jgi:hypothetical protein
VTAVARRNIGFGNARFIDFFAFGDEVLLTAASRRRIEAMEVRGDSIPDRRIDTAQLEWADVSCALLAAGNRIASITAGSANRKSIPFMICPPRRG